MDRTQFTFYESFARAIRRIRKPSDRAAAYDAIIDYALYGTEPDLDNLPDSVCIVFDLIKPNLDTSRRKAAGGKNGRPEKDAGKIEERSEKDTGNKKKKENKKEGEKEKEKENECSVSPLTPQKRESMIGEGLEGRGGDLIIAASEWVQYKGERREPYKETGLKSLITQIRKAADEYGDDAVIDVIRRSMSANYQGIVFDWLKKQKQTASQRKYTTAAEYVPPKPKSVSDVWDMVNKI